MRFCVAHSQLPGGHVEVCPANPTHCEEGFQSIRVLRCVRPRHWSNLQIGAVGGAAWKQTQELGGTSEFNNCSKEDCKQGPLLCRRHDDGEWLWLF